MWWTHWALNKTVLIMQTTCSNIFSWHVECLNLDFTFTAMCSKMVPFRRNQQMFRLLLNIKRAVLLTKCLWRHRVPPHRGEVNLTRDSTVYPKKYAHGFVVLCFVVVMQSFIMNSHEIFIHIHQGCFAGTGAIVRLPQCQWSKPDGYGKISKCITTTKHSKAKTVCIFLWIYCMRQWTKGWDMSWRSAIKIRPSPDCNHRNDITYTATPHEIIFVTERTSYVSQ